MGHIADIRLRELRTVVQIHLMPLFGRNLSFIRDSARIVKCLFVDNIEYDLRIHITTSGAGTGLCICVCRSLLKISNRVDGIAVIDGIATLVQQPQTVEELVNIARRLVDIHDDQLTLIGLLFQEVDHHLCVTRRQTRRRLIEEEHSRLTDQLESDVQTFTLTTGDIFVDGRTDFEILDGIESQVFKCLRHAGIDTLRIHSLKAEFSGVPEVLIDRQFLDEQVILRHETNQILGFRLCNIVTVDGDGTFLRPHAAIEQ